jgi:adenylosuccinate lyase
MVPPTISTVWARPTDFRTNFLPLLTELHHSSIEANDDVRLYLHQEMMEDPHALNEASSAGCQGPWPFKGWHIRLTWW